MAERKMPKRQPAVETEVVDTPVVNELVVEPEKPKTIMGVVSNCKKLNLRKKPNKSADVLRELTEGTTLEIITTSEEWCKVCTPDGVKGFCMKAYIVVDRM